MNGKQVVADGADPIEVIVRGAQRPRLIVVLCHGFGADAADLVPLADELDAGVPVRWLFPQAPWRFPAGWGAGRAWFPSDPQEIAAFATGASFRELPAIDSPDLRAAGQSVLALALRARAIADGVPLVIGGFSQGAMVAVEAALAAAPGETPADAAGPGAAVQADASADAPAAGLLLMSGALVARARWQGQAAHGGLRGVMVMQTHGRADQVLAYEDGEALGEFLDHAGARRRMIGFDGGHTIAHELLAPLAAWLVDIASA